LYVESPDSVSSSFGYKTKGKCYYHTEKELIERFVHTVCAGGNYLLNNGPMGNGQLDPEAIRLYGAIGEWLKKNGESIYETRRNPLPVRPQWGDCSVSKDGRKLYLHILLRRSKHHHHKHLPVVAASAEYLANGEKARFSQDGTVLEVGLPADPISQYDTVVKVTFTESVGE
jgi:alpha-L-fucosidase